MLLEKLLEREITYTMDLIIPTMWMVEACMIFWGMQEYLLNIFKDEVYLLNSCYLLILCRCMEDVESRPSWPYNKLSRTPIPPKHLVNLDYFLRDSTCRTRYSACMQKRPYLMQYTVRRCLFYSWVANTIDGPILLFHFAASTSLLVTSTSPIHLLCSPSRAMSSKRPSPDTNDISTQPQRKLQQGVKTSSCVNFL